MKKIFLFLSLIFTSISSYAVAEEGVNDRYYALLDNSSKGIFYSVSVNGQEVLDFRPNLNKATWMWRPDVVESIDKDMLLNGENNIEIVVIGLNDKETGDLEWPTVAVAKGLGDDMGYSWDPKDVEKAFYSRSMFMENKDMPYTIKDTFQIDDYEEVDYIKNAEVVSNLSVSDKQSILKEIQEAANFVLDKDRDFSKAESVLPFWFYGNESDEDKELALDMLKMTFESIDEVDVENDIDDLSIDSLEFKPLMKNKVFFVSRKSGSDIVDVKVNEYFSIKMGFYVSKINGDWIIVKN